MNSRRSDLGFDPRSRQNEIQEVQFKHFLALALEVNKMKSWRSMRAETREQRPESRESRAESQRAESREQRAESREQRAESRKQRAESRQLSREMSALDVWSMKLPRVFSENVPFRVRGSIMLLLCC